MSHMAQINIRNVPDDLYHRVRLAAACGADRIPKGALARFVMRALRRAVENSEPGAGLPRLKLCAGCFEKNRQAFTAPRSQKVQPTQYETAREIIVAPLENGSNAGCFAHLLGEAAESAGDSSPHTATGVQNKR